MRRYNREGALGVLGWSCMRGGLLTMLRKSEFGLAQVCRWSEERAKFAPLWKLPRRRGNPRRTATRSLVGSVEIWSTRIKPIRDSKTGCERVMFLFHG
jgi:hypothetical protein